jgi:hypothetical protein
MVFLLEVGSRKALLATLRRTGYAKIDTPGVGSNRLKP